MKACDVIHYLKIGENGYVDVGDEVLKPCVLTPTGRFCENDSWLQYKRRLPENSDKSIHYEMKCIGNEIEVAVHVEKETDARFQREDVDALLERAAVAERLVRFVYGSLKCVERVDCVSYTNPKVMHWITDLLHWLYVKGAAPMDEFLAYAQGIARSAVRQFLAEGDYNKGVQTPNIVLNYLDYLLWMDREELVLKPEFHSLFETSFAFEFRNSVEHWYPQHPDADGCPEWGSVDEAHGVVDRFGNLALLQSNINAHFSNLPPRGKCGYGATKNGSVKLRIMAALTGLAANSAQVDENETWRSSICEKHEEDMLKILKADCESHPDDVEMLQ